MLHRFLLPHFHHPFALLDFGCGDAALMAPALAGTAVADYRGADISTVALDLAQRNMRPAACRQTLSAAEGRAIWDHVRQADFPESPAGLAAMGHRHRFKHVVSLFTDPSGIYQLTSIHA